MMFPIPLRRNLPENLQYRWIKHVKNSLDRDRTREEGIWRRTQEVWNSDESNWHASTDKRRRIVHYNHRYDMRKVDDQFQLELAGSYIYYSLTLPETDLSEKFSQILNALRVGEWVVQGGCEQHQWWRLEELSCSVDFMNSHPEDRSENRVFPSNYKTLDVTLRSNPAEEVAKRLPWEVLAKGMRKKEARENPSLVEDLSVLIELRPFHVEIGCGVSLEAGVPALHHLHDLYRVTDPETGSFVFGGTQDDLIERLVSQPRKEFAKLCQLYEAAFLAEPTEAHQALIALQREGHLVGDIMTNNFDALTHRVGLKEQFLRRYDESVPKVDFHPDAKSLHVIGSHADRRRVQERARDRGLKVVYLDPEGYQLVDRFVSYPLEGPKDGDLVCRRGASDGLTHLCTLLGVQL